MIDLSHLPTSNRFYKEVFYPNSTVSGGAWYTWQKPRGINYIAIFAAAGGGGGAAGAVGATGALGGGGGGAPHSARNIFLASALPDILYFSVGHGGAGGTTSAAAGSAGINTYVATFYGTTNLASILYSLTGGSGGTTGTGGAARAESGLASFNLIGNSFAGFGQNSNIAGRAGTAAGTSLDLINAASNTFVNPGTGGGTLPASLFGIGGSYTATNGTFGPVFPSHFGGGNVNESGTNGYQVPGLFYFYGGTGAASGTSIANGEPRRGGNGGPGCGAGGGGAALTGSTVGAGGNGGPGFVIVIGW